jgi:hypothetical protein
MRLSWSLFMESRLSRSLFTIFLTMESRLSRSLFTIFSSRCNRGYHRAFSWNRGYHGAFSRFFLRWNRGYHRAFSRFFFTMELRKTHSLGETLFIYVTKSIYIGSTSLKTLPLDLGPPLQGKEYGPPYSKLSARGKCFCSQNNL